MSIIYQEHRNQHYKVVFNQTTGFQIRIEDVGHKEPFWSEDGPELLDFSITSFCERECPFCYRQADRNGHHITLKDAERVISQAKQAGVLQIALGGGNPNQHPQFIKILKMIRSNDIVPSYTTNGVGLTEDILRATKEYCGAMALSIYPPVQDNTISLIKYITEKEIKLNLHIILSTLTYELLISWLKTPPEFLKKINAIIVLNYKPIVKSQDNLILSQGEEEIFYKTVSMSEGLNIGFDSCSVPGIVTYLTTKKELIEPCEAARFSAFISEDMKMYPCSFMANTDYYGDLRKSSLVEIWRNNEYFISYRDFLKHKGCNHCELRSRCLGGCHFMPQINQCKNERIRKTFKFHD